MIRRFRALPIRRKLISMIMTTSVAVVLLSSLGYLVADYYAARNDLRSEIAAQAQFIGENVAAPLRFNDPDAAHKTLQSFASSPNLRAACVYTAEKLFASYTRPDSGPCDASPPPDGASLDASRIALTTPCMLDGQRVGTVTIRSDLAVLQRRFRQQSAIVASLLLVTLGVATLMSARLQSLVSDPIVALSRTASEVSSRGDYSIRAARTSDDELGSLVDAFNRMLERIQEREGELSKANADLRREVSERRRAEQERAAMLVREREAGRLKDEFLATLSHELRTPLNAILGWTKLMRSNAVPPASYDRALEKIERNALVQARLVEDLLEISRITTGKLRLDVRPLDLVVLVNTAIETIRPTAEARGVLIERDIAAQSLPTGGDADRLQQVIWNLLSNGVKFTPSGGTVRIGLRRRGLVDELIVSDTGIGIAPAFLPSVFETFRQADASPTRLHGGLGLGLSIVRQLVELHAGTVKAESAGEGHGSVFTVELPVRTAGSLAAAHAPAVSPAAHHAKVLTGFRILAVDDDADTRELLHSVLQRAGAEVRATSSAAEAFSACLEAAPDALISDIGMPGRDGYRLIQDIHASLGSATPRVAIALSAYAAPRDRERSLEAGFHHHIAKPVDPDALVRTLYSLLTGRSAAAS